jgi:hypothetical protein
MSFLRISHRHEFSKIGKIRSVLTHLYTNILSCIDAIVEKTKYVPVVTNKVSIRISNIGTDNIICFGHEKQTKPIKTSELIFFLSSDFYAELETQYTAATNKHGLKKF